jgi:hypothetical protein
MNVMIGALPAVVRELDRCEREMKSGQPDDASEEPLGPSIDQLHVALADLSDVYAARRSKHRQLLDPEAVRAHFVGRDRARSGAS